MPLVDLAPSDVLAPVGATPLGPYRPPAEPAQPAPGIGETIGAAFRQNNIIASIASNNTGLDNSPQDGYNPWEDIKGTKYERYWENFARANNPRYAAALKMQIDMEEQDRRTIDAAGVPGFIAGLAAGIIDPTILLPGGALVKTGRAGYSVSRSALSVGLAAGAGVGVQEAFLQGSQELRTAGESAFAIGGGVVLGALLGAGAARILSPSERAVALRAFDNVIAGAREDEGGAPAAQQARGLSAETTELPTREDLTVAGGAAGAVAKATSFLSPQLRVAQSFSARARQIFEEMAEGTIYRQMHGEGRSLGPAAETLARLDYEGPFAQALTESQAIYREMTKAGVNMPVDEFELAVGRAMRRGDQGENDYISRAAQVYRSRVFEPLKEKAIREGLLPEDVSVDTATSYFSRVYDRERMIAREDEFKARVLPFISDRIAASYQEAKDALLRRAGSVEQRVADLRLAPEERLRVLDELENRAAQIEAEYADVIDARSEMNDLRRAAKENPAIAAQNEQEIARLRSLYGQRLKAFEEAARDLRSRRRGLQMGYAAIADRQERILQNIEDVEEANRRSMETLIRKGAQLQRERQRLAPERLEQKINGMREQFATVSQAADRAATRAEQTLAKFESDLEKVRERAGRDAEKGINRSAELADAEDTFVGKTRALLEREAKYRRARADRLAEINARIEAAEQIDLGAKMDEVMRGVEKLVGEVGDRALRRGAKIERLRTRLADLDPKKVDEQIASLEKLRRDLDRRFLDRWETDKLITGIRLDGPDTPNFSVAARDVVDQVVNKILGRNTDAGILPDWATPVTRGPMKDRTFNVPDELIEDFLESNARTVGERYGRQMSAEIALTRKFGRADMRDQLQAISDDYNQMRAAVSNAPNAEAAMAAIGREPGMLDRIRERMKGEGYEQATKERLMKMLDADERSVKDDIAAVRDIIRGTYQAAANASDFGRISRALTSFNFMRQMGGAALSSISEFYRGAMVHGFVPFFRDAVAPLMTNLDAIKMSVKEAEAASLMVERATRHRLATVGEIGDPYARGNAIERILQQGTTVASKWSLLPLLTDMQESISSVASQNRLLGIFDKIAGGKTVSDKDRALVAFLGADNAMAERIGNLFRQHGEVLDGVKIANTEKWGDAVAVETYRAVINKDVRSLIVRPGAGDLPLFARTPLGRMMLQFRSFTLAAHQRVTLRGLQEGPGQFIGGMVAFASMGMLVAYLKSVRQGEEARQRFVENSRNNPFFLVGEGIDNANPFPLLMDAANTMERVSRATTPGGFNPIKTPIRALGGETQQASVRGNYVDVWGALGGPSANLVSDVAKASGLAGSLGSGEAPKEAQINAGLRLLPFNSYLGMREVLQALHGDSPYLRTR
jgi:hypothetical protein